MAILTSADWPAVRQAVHVSMDANLLPTATIELDIYSGAADQDVIKLDPDAESRTGDEALAITRAAVFYCAARLCPVVDWFLNLSTTTRDLRWSRQLPPAEQRANELRGMAVEEINEVLTPGAEAASMPRMFTKVTGTRGK